MTNVKTRSLLIEAADRAINYLEAVNDRHVFPHSADIKALKDALNTDLPETSCSAEQVLGFLDKFGSPATVTNAGGRYFGFVTGGALPSTVATNWLAAAWDQNSFGMTSSPAVAILEDTALKWLKQALALPESAEGTLVTGATMANFTCLAAARHAVLAINGWDVESKGLFGAPEITVIVGEEAHASIFKVLAMLGLGRDRVITIPVDSQGRILAEALPKITEPTIVCLQAGNVNSGAFDPAEEIVSKVRDQGAWVHIDGAFGLWARVSKKISRLAEGFELADSWATDAHKWLNVPYDCGAALVRDPAALRGAMSISSSYLMPGENREAIDLTPDNSRRARAVEVWAALKTLGQQGLEKIVDRNCAQAQWMARGLADAGIEVLNEVVLNQLVVAFGDGEKTKRVIRRIQESGVCWCGGTHWQGRDAMRISFSSWATTQTDVEMSFNAIVEGFNTEG